MTASQLKTIVPALASFSDAQVEALIVLADPYFDLDRWGDQYVEGIACWVAHWLVSNAEQTAEVDADDVDHMGIGPISMRRNSTLVEKQAADPYMRTMFGQRYRFLANQVGAGGTVA